jgi:hypothetical protein
MRYLSPFALVLVAALGLGCADIDDPSQEFYEEYYALWQANGPASYDMVLLRSCVCTPPASTVLIQVRNRTVTARTFQDPNPGTEVPANQAGNYPDVPGLFRVIQSALRRRVAGSSYSYNGDYGYPEIINIDFDISRADDNIFYRVQRFTPVTP